MKNSPNSSSGAQLRKLCHIRATQKQQSLFLQQQNNLVLYGPLWDAKSAVILHCNTCTQVHLQDTSACKGIYLLEQINNSGNEPDDALLMKLFTL